MQSLVLIDVNSTSTVQVQQLISNLSVATSPTTTMNTSLFAQDLNTTTVVVGRVLDHLMESVARAEPGDLLPFEDVCLYVLSMNCLVHALTRFNVCE